MRAYAKKRQIIAECRKQMEKVIRKDHPELSATKIAKLARHYVGRAIREQENPANSCVSAFIHTK